LLWAESPSAISSAPRTLGSRRGRCRRLSDAAPAGRVRLEGWLYAGGDSVPDGLYERRQWLRLGYRVRRGSRPSAYLIGEEDATPLYDRASVGPTRRPVKGPRAWRYLRGHYGGDEQRALARSVWVANRLVKIDSDHK
jgi:hypothetical protein